MKAENSIGNISELPVSKRTVLNILYTQQYISEKLTEIFKSNDLSTEQYNVLRILRGRKGCPANMFSIQESMIAKTSNTTRLVDKLLLKGFVTRKVCPDNRRKIEVLITEKGLNALKALDPLVDSAEASLAGNLSATELEQLNGLLEKYRQSSH